MSPIRSHRPNCRGFTLIELVTSTAVLSILLAATISAVLFASRALPGRGSVGARLGDAAALQAQIGAELAYATVVDELAPHAVTFTVADRTGDGESDVIRYAWSGVAGAPLTRSLNGAAAVPVLDDVHTFSLQFDRYRRLNPPSYAEGEETLVHSYTSTASLARFAVASSTSVAQMFTPSLPEDAECWRITRVWLRLTDHGSATGETRVQIRGSEGLLNLPSGVVADQSKLPESGLPEDGKYGSGELGDVPWQEVTFSGSPLFPARGGGPLHVALIWVSDAHSCDVIYQSLLAPGGLTRSSDGGASWSTTLTQSIPMRVWGRVYRRNPDTYTYYLHTVRLTLAAGTGAAAQLQWHVPLRNLPEVIAP